MVGPSRVLIFVVLPSALILLFEVTIVSIITVISCNIVFRRALPILCWSTVLIYRMLISVGILFSALILFSEIIITVSIISVISRNIVVSRRPLPIIVTSRRVLIYRMLIFVGILFSVISCMIFSRWRLLSILPSCCSILIYWLVITLVSVLTPPSSPVTIMLICVLMLSSLVFKIIKFLIFEDYTSYCLILSLYFLIEG